MLNYKGGRVTPEMIRAAADVLTDRLDLLPGGVTNLLAADVIAAALDAAALSKVKFIDEDVTFPPLPFTFEPTVKRK